MTEIPYYPKMVIIWDGAIVFGISDSRFGNQRKPLLNTKGRGVRELNRLKDTRFEANRFDVEFHGLRIEINS